MSTKPKTKPRCCIHCGKEFPPRTRRDKQYCNDACRKAAERKALQEENGELRQRTRITQKRAQTSPLENLRTSSFMVWLIRQIARHGKQDCSLDCLGLNFDIEEIFKLYRLKAKISFKTATPCDVSHLVSCDAGGSFTPDNLVILPSSLNRSQGNRVSPPPLVGRTFAKLTTCTKDHDEIWKQLKARYGEQLSRFAEKHKNLTGAGKAEAINRVLDTPSSPLVLRRSLEAMEEADFKQLCDSLNIDYKAPGQGTSGDNDKPWSPSFIAHKFLYDVYERCPKQLFTSGKQILKLLHISGDIFNADECHEIYYWRFDRALASLRKRIAAQLNLTEEFLMNHIDDLQIDDLFITTNRDGSNTHIMVINADDADEADQMIFASPEFQQAVKDSQEMLRTTKSNLNVVDRYVSQYGDLASQLCAIYAGKLHLNAENSPGIWIATR